MSKQKLTKKEKEALETVWNMVYSGDNSVNAREIIAGSVMHYVLQDLEEDGYIKLTRKGKNNFTYCIPSALIFLNKLKSRLTDSTIIEEAINLSGGKSDEKETT